MSGPVPAVCCDECGAVIQDGECDFCQRFDRVMDQEASKA